MASSVHPALTLAGQNHCLAPLRATPVLTIEAGDDGLVGPGQAHAIAASLPRTTAVTLRGTQHHELFTGPAFVASIRVLLTKFYDKLPPA